MILLGLSHQALYDEMNSRNGSPIMVILIPQFLDCQSFRLLVGVVTPELQFEGNRTPAARWEMGG